MTEPTQHAEYEREGRWRGYQKMPAESVRPRYVVSSVIRYKATCQLCDWLSHECATLEGAEQLGQWHQPAHNDGSKESK